MLRIGKYLLIPGVMLAAGLPLWAQSNRIQDMDSNGDGVVTRDEWRGNDRAFRRHDWNRDGVLSGDEMLGRRDNRAAGDRAVRATNRLDRNQTGRVEGYEWPYNRDLFHKLDRNADSVLDATELANLNNATLEQLDRNRNGQIDAGEWPGGFAQLDQLDEDRNGRVSAEEWYQRGGEWQRRQRFNQWDTDRDGRITSGEWKSTPGLFDRLDRDANSVLSWDEFLADSGAYESPFWWRR